MKDTLSAGDSAEVMPCIFPIYNIHKHHPNDDKMKKEEH